MTDSIADLTFDARPDRIDVRDRMYMPPLRSLPGEWPRPHELAEYFPDYVDKELILDQGREGACTGFGLACVINYLFWRNAIHENDGKPVAHALTQHVSTRMLYHLARYYDEWPGEDYEGSSCRGAIKAWHKHGVCSNALWPYRTDDGVIVFLSPKDGWREDAVTRPLGVYYRIEKQSIVDMQAAIHEVGAIYVSANVHSGWELRTAQQSDDDMRHETIASIAWNGEQKKYGGHAFAIVGYNKRGFIVQNSWSSKWGTRGFAVMSYDDWLAHGTDAWVCVLGAPIDMSTSPIHVAQTANTSVSSKQAQIAGAPAQWLLDIVKKDKQKPTFAFGQGPVAPWSEETAYLHTVVLGNNGRVIQKIVTSENAASEVESHACKLPLAWHKQQGGNTLKLALYAHGGLNKEEESLQRIKILAPYFKANGIYPFFITWRTGILDSIKGILYDQLEKNAPSFKRNFGRSGIDIGDVFDAIKAGANETIDRTLEVISENLGPKTIWSQMKQNAKASCEVVDKDPRGGLLVANALAKLQNALKKNNHNLEIHLIGHSAGSIIGGYLLQALAEKQLNVSSCWLYAAACSVEFANNTFVKAVGAGQLKPKDFYIYNLSNQLELADSVGPYHKSLLYLVSRALEEWHKTPLAGFDNAKQRDPNDRNLWAPPTVAHVQQWQKFLKTKKPQYRVTTELKSAIVVKWTTDTQCEILDAINAEHGGFDNDIHVVTETLKTISGQAALKYPVVNLSY